MPGVRLSMSIGRYPWTAALKDGEVSSDRIGIDFQDVEPAYRAFRPMANDLAFDVSEIAIITYLLAKDAGRPLVLLPVVLMRQPELALLVCRSDAPMHEAADLAGCSVGVRSYTQTTATWIRGLISDGHPELDMSTIQWRTFDAAHVDGYVDPPQTIRLNTTSTLLEGLAGGEYDAAVIGWDARHTPGIRPVIDGWTAEEAAWTARTGAVPVNHLLCARSDVLNDFPWLRDELVSVFARAAEQNTAPADPEAGDADSADLLTSLRAATRFAHEQGITRRLLDVEELFNR